MQARRAADQPLPRVLLAAPPALLPALAPAALPTERLCTREREGWQRRLRR